MPAKTPRCCRQVGCWELVTSKDGYCDEHRKHQHRQHNLRRTDKASTKIYSTKRWKDLRAAHLDAFPFCAHCGALGEVVHHVVEHGGDPALAYDPGNLETVCVACHNRVHQRGAVKEASNAH